LKTSFNSPSKVGLVVKIKPERRCKIKLYCSFGDSPGFYRLELGKKNSAGLGLQEPDRCWEEFQTQCIQFPSRWEQRDFLQKVGVKGIRLMSVRSKEIFELTCYVDEGKFFQGSKKKWEGGQLVFRKIKLYQI